MALATLKGEKPDLFSDTSARVADGLRVLTLGRALSNTVYGTLSQRHEDGFVVGRLDAIQDTDAFVSLADRDGRVTLGAAAFLPQEDLLLHAALYKARQAGGVAIVRSPRLAVWGAAKRALPVRYFQMFGYTKAEEIPVANYDVEDVERALAANPHTPAILLTNGKAIIWGGDISKAARLVLSLEEAAYVTALAERLGGAKDYPLTVRTQIYDSLQAQQRR